MKTKIELLRNADWGDIFKKLVAKTEERIDKYSWKSNTYPMGHNAESIVQEAIESVLTNKRNWNPDEGDLEMYLWWIIKSKLSHLYNSKTYHPDNLSEESLDQASEEEWKQDSLESKINENLISSEDFKNPEELLISRENTLEVAQEMIIRLLEACDDYPELKDIVYAIYNEGCDPKPKSLAEHLNRPVKTIYSQIRTLRSRARKI